MEDSKKILSKKNLLKAWLAARPVVILALSVLIVFGAIYITGSILIRKFLSPVDSLDATPVEFVIEDGWGASTIAKHLFSACGEGEAGLIRNKAVFKIYVDFMGKAKDLRAGHYYLSKNMDIPTIIDALCRGGTLSKIIHITIPEGTTVEGVARLLSEAGMYIDKAEFLELCRTGEKFTVYEFINNVVLAKEPRRYALEGYLFPDTYDFYIDASSETVITKMLDRFEDVCYTDQGEGENPKSYAERAKELGMSVDEIMSLAALIEREAVMEQDFFRVSAVFHNRLNTKMLLQSDAALSYIFSGDERKLVFTEEEVNTDSPYNTHRYKGVPLGAICNPGRRAIKAALYPDTEYVNGGYFYFCLKDGKTGELVYAKTLEEHNRNVALYKGNW